MKSKVTNLRDDGTEEFFVKGEPRPGERVLTVSVGPRETKMLDLYDAGSAHNVGRAHAGLIKIESAEADQALAAATGGKAKSK